MNGEGPEKSEKIYEEEADHDTFIEYVENHHDSCDNALEDMRKAFYMENYVGYLRAFYRAMQHLQSVAPDAIFGKDGLPLA